MGEQRELETAQNYMRTYVAITMHLHADKEKARLSPGSWLLSVAL